MTMRGAPPPMTIRWFAHNQDYCDITDRDRRRIPCGAEPHTFLTDLPLKISQSSRANALEIVDVAAVRLNPESWPGVCSRPRRIQRELTRSVRHLNDEDDAWT